MKNVITTYNLKNHTANDIVTKPISNDVHSPWWRPKFEVQRNHPNITSRQSITSKKSFASRSSIVSHLSFISNPSRCSNTEFLVLDVDEEEDEDRKVHNSVFNDSDIKAKSEDVEKESTFSERSICIAIIGLVTFTGDASRGVIFPALWPYCKYLGGSEVVLGWLVSTFSIGRLVVTNYIGMIADVYRHRYALLISNIMLCFGAILWANASLVLGLPLLFIAQFIMGLGTGSLGVTRSYVVEQTVPANRTYMLARLSALQYAGFAATPIIGWI
jgi:hypothetical protein